MKNIYLLKDISVKTGLSIYTIKYYLKRGLVKEFGRSPDTNIRYFDDLTVKSLLRIRMLRKKGVSLEAIKVKMGKIA